MKISKTLQSQADTPGGTAGSRVYACLRADVISGELAPGQRLTLELLKERYQVGATPIREALYRLCASLLVENEDHQGFRVTDISLAHLEQVVTAREHFESLILRESIARGDLDWEGRVLAAHHQMTRFAPHLSDGSPCRGWVTAHRQFHYEVLSGSRHFFLEHFQDLIWDHFTRYRNVLRAGNVDEHLLEDDHAQVLKTVLARDAELAVLVLRRHIQHGAAELRKAMVQRVKPEGAATPYFRNYNDLTKTVVTPDPAGVADPN